MKAMFVFSAAEKRDLEIDAWLASKPPGLGKIACAWFGAMRRAGDDVQELMHDGCPVACVGRVAFGYVNVFMAHVNVGFFNGSDLDDPADMLEGSGKRMRHVKLRPGADMDEAALGRLIEESYADVKRRLEAVDGTPAGPEGGGSGA